MAKFDPFLSRVEGLGAQSKETKGSNFAALRSGAIALQARRAKSIQSKNLAIAIWQPCLRRQVPRLVLAPRAPDECREGGDVAAEDTFVQRVRRLRPLLLRHSEAGRVSLISYFAFANMLQ